MPSLFTWLKSMCDAICEALRVDSTWLGVRVFEGSHQVFYISDLQRHLEDNGTQLETRWFAT